MVVGTPYQRELGTLEWEDPKRETNKWSAPALGQGDGAEIRHLERGGIRD